MLAALALSDTGGHSRFTARPSSDGGIDPHASMVLMSSACIPPLPRSTLARAAHISLLARRESSRERRREPRGATRTPTFSGWMEP